MTVLEYFDRILTGIDSEIASDALVLFRKQGLDIQLGVKVLSAKAEGGACVVQPEGSDAIHCDRVLAATGRKPATSDIGLETVGLATDERGWIQVDGQYRTAGSRCVCDRRLHSRANARPQSLKKMASHVLRRCNLGGVMSIMVLFRLLFLRTQRLLLLDGLKTN